MWEKLMGKTKRTEHGLAREYSYASHHHLIPLYALTGLAILALLVIGCYVSILWQSNERESFRSVANLSVKAVENLYVPTVISPTEKKQYIYPANVRLGVSSPYDTLRYEYDPGIGQTKTSSMLTLTTSNTLHDLTIPIINNPGRTFDYMPKLQRCSRLFVVRFEPGLPPQGGFAPVKDIRLKDGRTAYVHKNTACIPPSTQAMNTLENIEKDILGIESY